MIRRCPGKIRCRGAPGFTLFEILVALALLSLLTVLLAGQIRFGQRAWESGAAVADDLAELQAVQGFLRRQLAQVRPLHAAREDGARRSRPIFEGGPQGLRFVALGSPRLGPAPYNLIELAHAQRRGQGELALDWSPHYPVTRTQAGPAPRRRVLLSRVATIRFRYFGILDRRDRR